MTDQGFSIQGINHLGIAAKDPEKAKWFFSQVLRLPHLGDELVASQKTLTSMFDSVQSQKNSPRIELLENQEGQSGPIAAYLEKKGGGIHHIALTVDNVTAAINHMLENGVTMIDETPRPGAHNTSIAFIHPKSTGGILVELVEEA